jgi:mannose-6-phosphate isomerase-like protein (cupin superfamily)
MASFYELDKILSTIERDEYFVDFLNKKSLDAGIIRLREHQKDTQTIHSLDELYYVIEGEGYILVNQKHHRISKGTTIFVPAYTEHNFQGSHGDLIVLYVFARG